MTKPTTDQMTRDATEALDAFRASIEPALRRAVTSRTAVPRFVLTEDHVVGDLRFTTTAELMLANCTVFITCSGIGNPDIYRQLAHAMGATEVTQDDDRHVFVFSNNLDKTLVDAYMQMLSGITPRFEISDSAPAAPNGVAMITQPSPPAGPVADVTPYAQFPRPDESAKAKPPTRPDVPTELVGA